MKHSEDIENIVNMWISVLNITLKDLEKGTGQEYENALEFIKGDLFIYLVNTLNIDTERFERFL